MQRVKWVSWIVGVLLLAGCGRQAAAPAEAPAQEPTVAATIAATETPEPTPAPTATPVAQSPAAASVSPLPTAEQATGPSGQSDEPAGADDASFAVPDWFAFAETYINEQVGFQLRYPADWTLLDVAPDVRESSDNYAVTINSWETVDGGGGGIPAGQTKVDILVARTDAATLEDVVAQRRAELTEGEEAAEIVDEATWELESGLQAQRWTLQGGQADSYQMIALIDGWTVTLSGLGDEQRFDEVARTLQPLAQ